MADENAGESQTTEATQEQETTETTTETVEVPDDFDPKRAMETIRQQRESERQLKADLKKTQDALKKREEADLSEQEKATKRIEELEGQVSSKQQVVQNAFLRAAIADSDHQVASVADTAVLLRQAGVEFDDDDQPKDLEKQLKELLDQKPHLRAGTDRPQGTADGGVGEAAASGTFNDALREAARR